MMIWVLLASMAVAFFITYLATPKFIKILERRKIVGRDLMKPGKPRVAEMGTPVVLLGFVGGILLYLLFKQIFFNQFYLQESFILTGFIGTVLTIMVMGMFDELTILSDEKEGKSHFEKFKRRGLSVWGQVLFALFASIPMILVMWGVSSIDVPFLGFVEIGLLYPLFIVPLGIIGASNATNMLAGFNGMQAGIGIVMMLFLGTFAYVTGAITAAVIAFIFTATLIAFLFYNWYPAKIFPGGLDYVVGTFIVGVTFIGHMETFALILFMPWFLEFLLKARGKFKGENFGILQEDGTLKHKGKVESIAHAIMKMGKFNEWQVSTMVIGLIAWWCSLISLLFWLV